MIDPLLLVVFDSVVLAAIGWWAWRELRQWRRDGFVAASTNRVKFGPGRSPAAKPSAPRGVTQRSRRRSAR
ncbi:MAG TPA: hypothetical protein VFU71_11220 [Burkholderiaceae bacterium]|nr:hypothetical protein [Burkholderiaceae bacterium]